METEVLHIDQFGFLLQCDKGMFLAFLEVIFFHCFVSFYKLVWSDYKF